MRSNRHTVVYPNPPARPAPGSSRALVSRDRSCLARSISLVLGLLALLSGPTSAPGEAQPPAPATVPAVVQPNAGVPRSVFISDPSFGKDPFFPESKRRLKDLPALPHPTTNQVNGAVVLADPGFDKFTLKGISRSGDRKLAMINFYTFAEGEEQEVKVDNQIITVKCELIKERSAVIRIKDRTKELMLRDGVY